MKLTIIRIDQEIVTCELEDGTLLDIAKGGLKKTSKSMKFWNLTLIIANISKA